MLWTRLIGKLLIHTGVVLMGIAAAVALVETVGEANTALANGTTPPDGPLYGIPPAV